ncbi:MAG: ATP-binding protein [Pseudomonadota bacterium]
MALSYVLYANGLLSQYQSSLVVAGCLVVSYLGYLMMQQLITRLLELADDLCHLSRGEAVSSQTSQGSPEFEHIQEIAGSFQNLLGEFKDSTKSLEDLVYKLSSLAELTEVASSIPEAEHMLQLVLQRAMAAVDARMGSIMLLEANREELKVVAAQGHPEHIVGHVVAVGEEVAGHVVQSGQMLLVADIEKDRRFQRRSDPKYGNGSFISMPLKASGKVIGVINLAHKGDDMVFEELDIKFLNTLMNHISFALEHSRLLREAKEAAVRLEGAVHEKASQLDMARRQVLQAEKLSALGELVASIAHELNNPLTGIMGYSQLLQQREHNPKNERDLQRIFDEAQRASRIVHNLLSFARKHKPERRPCDLNEIVQKVLELRSYDLRLANIQVRFESKPKLASVSADENQIQQVLLNLINNAAQAVSGKSSEGSIVLRTWDEGQKVICSVEDNGVGISSETADLVFDPFFTTKELGKGTGLGLSISYGIIGEHQGRIHFKSEAGKGTTFFMELPVLEESQPEIESARETIQQPSRLPIKRILVVDDEQVILDLLTELLSGQGYRVDGSLSAKSALAKLGEAPYDMVICDVRMPGMDGPALYRQVKESRPDVARRFVFSTGDIIGQRTKEFLTQSGTNWLRKPFTGEQLMDTLSEAWQRINAN